MSNVSFHATAIMTHDDAYRTHAVAAYLLDELRDGDREAFEEHLFDCSICGTEIRIGIGLYRASRGESARDAELADTLRSIGEQLDALDHLRGAEFEDELRRIESYAAPYSIALFHEISRLDDIVWWLHLESALRAKPIR